MQSWCKTWLLNGSSRIRAKKKLLRKRKRACKSSWSRIGSLKSFYTDNSLEIGKVCEDLSWNHCTSTPHRSETNGIAERAVRRVKEGTSAVLLQSSLNGVWWADCMECYTYLCEQNTLTRHIFSCLHACLTVSHVTLAQGVSARHPIHVSCACVFDLSHLLLHPPDL